MALSDKVDEEETSFKATLIDYCENTGVYTLRQIVEPTQYQIRRVYWVAILITGFIMFGVQTYDSTMRFLSNESSVSMEINYNDSVRFPAVTICNQNAFRATKVAELGLYKEVSALYSTGKISSNTINEQRLANMTLYDLYTTTAHNLSDLLVQCTWDERDCLPGDFATSLTDYGVCHTFNMEQPGVEVKHINRAGTQHALQLELNVEQYEYMLGPNAGAGIQVYLHDQEEAIPVKDIGKPVPPGTHAQVIAKITKVTNLKHPYGKCEDDMVLQYHHQYNKHSCNVDCLQRHLVAKCGCREFYMPPSKANLTEPPICTISQVFNCGSGLREQCDECWNNYCICPVPCKYTSVESFISYGSTSNFDMNKILTGNTSALQAKYLYAKEVEQRVNKYTVSSDELQTSAFESVVTSIDEMYDLLEQRLNQTVHDMHEILEEIETRAEFHSGRALNEVRYMVEYNYIRYFNVYSERVFNFVTSNYYTIGGSVKRFVSEIAAGANDSNLQTREAMWFPIQNELHNKLDLITRTLDYLEKFNHSYATAEPLGTYKATINGIYDREFIALELFTPVHGNLEKYVSDVVTHLGNLIGYIGDMTNITKDCVYNLTCNQTQLSQTVFSVEYSFGRFNYYIFLLNAQVVSAPLDLINQKITEFTTLNTKMEDYHDALEDIRAWLQDLLTKAKSGFWHNIQALTVEARTYMQNGTLQKKDLAAFAGSTLITESILNTTQLLSQLRTRGQEFADGLQRVKQSAFDLYLNMVQETTTKNFYSRLNNEVKEVIANASTATYYIPLFESLLRRSISINSHQELIPLLNTDFIDLNFTELEMKIASDFEVLQKLSNVDTIMGNLDTDFETAITDFRTSLSTYLESTKINPAFFRENFLRMDIFLSELSYTDISQQVAYDINNLLGDIGGSAGLFVGASLITLFEILDILCCGAILLRGNLMKKSETAPNNGQPKSCPYQNNGGEENKLSISAL